MLLSNKAYNNYRYSIPIPGEAKANIFIIEDSEGNPHTIQCNIGKMGSDVFPWAFGFSQLLSSYLQNTSLDETIGFLAELSLDVAGYRTAGSGDSLCRSGPEAFWIALSHYRRFKQGE